MKLDNFNEADKQCIIDLTKGLQQVRVEVLYIDLLED